MTTTLPRHGNSHYFGGPISQHARPGPLRTQGEKPRPPIATRVRSHTASAERSRSFITHLVEFDYPERFVQEEAGHLYSSTTAIYTHVSDEYRNRLVERSLRARHAELWGDQM